MSNWMKLVIGAGAVIALGVGAIATWNWFLPLSGPVRESAAFSDCEACPEMLAVETGSYVMGEPDRMGLVDDMAAFIDEHFGGSVTRPLVVALTTAVLS